MSLRKTFFDTVAMSLVNVVRLLAQFIAVPILARILSPEDYGLVAMAMPFVLFGMMIADAGISMSLVRTSSAEKHIWSTCFWLSLLLGLALALLMVIIAPLSAHILEEPKLSPIIMTLAAVIIAQAASAVPGAALQQDHKFRLVAGIEIVTTLVGIAAAVIIGLNGGGAWALVGQQLVFYSLRVALTFRFSSFRPTREFRFGDVREHLLFGRDVLGVNLVQFFTRSLDNLIIGKVLASAAVGIYSMAFQFARIPFMLVTGPLQYVLYARLAKVKDDTQAIRATFLVLTRILAMLLFPGMGMAAAAYDPVFTVLLSQKWAASGKIFMLVAASCTLQAVTALGSTIMLVLGRADRRLRATIEFGVIWVAALLASVSFGLEWAAITFNVAVLLYSPRQLMLVLPLIECRAGTYWKTLAAPALATLGCIAVYEIVNQAWALGAWAQIGIAAALTLAGMAGIASAQFKSLKADIGLLR